MHIASYLTILHNPGLAPTQRGQSVYIKASHFLLSFLLMLLFTMTAPGPELASASFVIPVSEVDLTQQAKAIITGTVQNIASYWDDETGNIMTHITVSPDEVLKGQLGEGDIIIKQWGGSLGSRHMWIEGSPQFTTGEKVLLFLDQNPDGSAGVLQLYQGKFSLFTDTDTGKEFAHRGETPIGVHVLAENKTAAEWATSTADGFYEVAALKGRIAETLITLPFARQLTPATAFVTPIIPQTATTQPLDSFVLIGPIPIRWFEPDSGVPVTMSLNPTDILPGAEEQVDRAFQVWNSVRSSAFRFQRGNNTDVGGFSADGVNSITFNDPQGQLPDPVQCSGVLAATVHTVVSDESRTLHEQAFFRIVEADLVFANGWENCTAFRSQTNIAEIATHELGHVLGLGHTPNPDATMFFLAHFDGRGATLHPDDEAGVAFLYPAASFPPCTYSLSRSKRSLDSRQSLATVKVATRDDCGWTAFSSAEWLVILEGESGSGKGSITYLVQENGTGAAREGFLFIAGKTFTVKQKATRKSSVLDNPPPFARGGGGSN
ncbi:MAG: matrixin family metalloprotease [Candidatus Binatia bacterium]